MEERDGEKGGQRDMKRQRDLKRSNPQTGEGIINRGEERSVSKHQQDDRVTDEYTLLHSKVLDGDVDFVIDFLRQKPELACELNSQGQSPLHLASARGHVGVVKVILEADPGACFVRDRDGMIPLHLAAIKGRLDVLEVLVTANIRTACILTGRGDPILHLCAYNYQFKALEKLVNLLKDLDEDLYEIFVKLKDNDDNTILHALSAMNEGQVIKLLIKNAKVDVSAVNKSGFTPLDVLLKNPPGIGRSETERFLACAGAKRARLEKMMDGFHGHSFSEARFSESLFACAVLMVILTFQAGLDPPGGVWQDTRCHYAASESSPPKLVHHFAGKSVMSYVDPKHYKCFSLFNNVAFYSSALVIVLLLRRGHSWALKILSTISVAAISVSKSCSLSFSSPYERSVTRSWTFCTCVVLLYASGMLLSIIVNKFHLLAEVLPNTTSNTGQTYIQATLARDPGPTSKMQVKIPNPNENSKFATKSHIKIVHPLISAW
ncbi:ankyrin repeat-containing-like protein [Cinnamomum micranthum f. kanehirae]|uniref:Ankyrin repeat-containing-like protein n=1 Tax=Cinnamomum micranthum f. kanehirae TaxID=337451 RepID=A0A443P0R3_9MAGN|nr:ankyrin repeat-containing-like protein [Cinnamomum micranthum f. kanehirae]